MALNIVRKIDDFVPVNNVIISVYDKTGLEDFVMKMIETNPGTRIYSTGGTYEHIAGFKGIETGKNLISISDYTRQPEMQGGLVKTLDYRIYAGILSEKYNSVHKKDLERAESVVFDMVVVNLYPFRVTAETAGVTPEQCRTNIDIGGPSMIRAAAKNFHRVASVCRPELYLPVLKEMEANRGSLSLAMRFRLASQAFSYTADYDRAIADYFASTGMGEIESCYEILQDR